MNRGCPHCGASVAEGASNCACGFSFREEETQVPAPAIVRGVKPAPPETREASERPRPNAAMLMSCPTCEARISKRAARCPKCGSAPYGHCQICASVILANATACSECGDPAPFGA